MGLSPSVPHGSAAKAGLMSIEWAISSQQLRNNTRREHQENETRRG
jgi:hypothetical protein